METSVTGNPDQLRLTMMSALREAERVASESPDVGAAVYTQAVGDDSAPSIVYVRKADAEPPEGARLHLRLKRPAIPENSSSMSVKDAVRFVLASLPEGISLRPSLVVERYPNHRFRKDTGIFAVQFLSTEGLNVATWIPDMAPGITMQLGFEGRGRVFGNAMNPISWDASAILAQLQEELQSEAQNDGAAAQRQRQ